MASKMSALEARMGAAPVKALWSSPCKNSTLCLRTTTSHPHPPTPGHSLQSPPLLSVTDHHHSKEIE